MTDVKPPRAPKSFSPDEEGLVISSDPLPGDEELAATGPAEVVQPSPGRFGWMSLLLGALGSLGVIAAGVYFARFVSVALERNDWVGWTAFGLLALAGLAAVVLFGREIVGFFRLRSLTHLRRRADQALATADRTAERAVVRALRRHLAGREDMKWNVKRFREHERDVQDPGDLLKIADRELIAPLDEKARGLVSKSAQRVGMVTLLSPIGLLTVGFVLFENLRLIRALAGVYGGRPGFLGSLSLFRTVILHILATGGVALTDDFLGQFLGQDLVRRLSKRLGEGVFNGALTARLGTAAIEVARPLPFIAARPVRFRDFRGALITDPVSGVARGIYASMRGGAKPPPEPTDGA